MDYYYNNGTRWVGALSAQQLRDLAASGVITPETLIMSPERIPPTPAHKAKGLFLQQIENTSSPAPSVTTELGILGNTFSFLSSAVSTVTTAIVPSSTKQEVVQQTFTLPALQEQPAINIGKFVFHVEGGTKIKGNINETFNPVIPPGLRKGAVEIFIHESGIRMKQHKSVAFIIEYSNIKTINQIKHRDIDTATLQGTGVMLATGLFLAGPIGAILAGALSRLPQWEHDKDFVLFEDRNDNQLFIETSSISASLFVERYREITEPKKWFW
jgi:hypothetical protein